MFDEAVALKFVPEMVTTAPFVASAGLMLAMAGTRLEVTTTEPDVHLPALPAL